MTALGMSAEDRTAEERALPPRWLGLLFALALAIRLAYVLAMAHDPYFTNPVIDAAVYDQIGWSIARGHGHPDDVFWQPPGYPYFLGGVWWLFGDSYLAPRLPQALLGAFNVSLVAWIAACWFARRVGLASGIVAAATGC